MSKFRVAGSWAELNYRGTSSVETLYPPIALVERRNLGDGVVAVLLEASGGMRAMLIGEETIAEVAALPKSSIDPQTGSFQLDTLVREHFEGVQAAGGAVVTPAPVPATLATDGAFLTLTTAAERHHFMLNGAELPVMVAPPAMDEGGDMLLTLRLPNRTLVPLRIAAADVVDAEKALVALQVASSTRQAATQAAAQTAAAWAKQPPQRAAAPVLRDHNGAGSVLTLGILSLLCCGLLGPFAWAKGNSVIGEMDRSQGVIWSNRGSATAGRICGIIATLMLVVGVVVAVLAAAGGQR